MLRIQNGPGTKIRTSAIGIGQLDHRPQHVAQGPGPGRGVVQHPGGVARGQAAAHRVPEPAEDAGPLRASPSLLRGPGCAAPRSPLLSTAEKPGAQTVGAPTVRDSARSRRVRRLQGPLGRGDHLGQGGVQRRQLGQLHAEAVDDAGRDPLGLLTKGAAPCRSGRWPVRARRAGRGSGGAAGRLQALDERGERARVELEEPAQGLDRQRPVLPERQHHEVLRVGEAHRLEPGAVHGRRRCGRPRRGRSRPAAPGRAGRPRGRASCRDGTNRWGTNCLASRPSLARLAGCGRAA